MTPDFVDGLAEAHEIAAVAGKSRIRLIAPIQDRPLYEGRSAEGVTLTELIAFEEHSDSDARSLVQKLQVDERSGSTHLDDVACQGARHPGQGPALAGGAR